jgi:hypothetical protein
MAEKREKMVPDHNLLSAMTTSTICIHPLATQSGALRENGREERENGV